jgi:hypothetical protein
MRLAMRTVEKRCEMMTARRPRIKSANRLNTSDSARAGHGRADTLNTICVETVADEYDVSRKIHTPRHTSSRFPPYSPCLETS